MGEDIERLGEELPNFRISAAVVRQLGEELVSDELTAIMELVKNSYDADADWVKISINTNDELQENELTYNNKKGYIIIEDNGHGMDYNDIISKWLFISVSHKRQMKKIGGVTKKGRTPLGDKGLGRLSTQRLGQVLEMFTGVEDQIDLHHVAFDWNDFTDEAALEKVNTNYNKHSKPKNRKGTRLIISDLRDSNIWIGDAADKFRGQLSKLIFPFKEARPFNIYLTINGQKNDLDEISDKLRKQAISNYKFQFDGSKLIVEGSLKLAKLQGNSNEKRELFNRLISADSGSDFYNFLKSPIDNKKNFLTDLRYLGAEGVFATFHREFDFEKDIKKETIIDDKTWEPIPANPGFFWGEIDEYNLSGTEEIESAYDKLSEYKQLVKNQVGVRIFRDGFGIKPYGMEDNDWLKLSKSQTSGGSFYLLRPENVIGFVSITARGNKFLTEKTDREGFIDSPYSKNFFSIINLAIQNINEVLDRTRRSYDDFKKKDAATKGKITTFKDTKSRLLQTAKESNEIEEQAKTIQNNLSITATKVSSTIERIKSEPLFSSTEENKALSILEEVNKILTEASNLFEKVNHILSLAKKLESDANYLEPKIDELENQIIQFSELAGLGITAEAFTHELYNIIDRVSAQTDQAIKTVKRENSEKTNFFIYAENVKSSVSAIRRQLNHLAPSLKFNRETKQTIRLSTFAEELSEYYETRFDGKINVQVEVINDFNININKGKLTQVTDNLILNSEYWLKEALKSKKDLNPMIKIEIKSPFISISDNGFGIVPSHEGTLFQAFVTTKPTGQGRGLGLFIVQQLLESVDSTITLLSKRNENLRRYIFQINFDSILS